MERDKDTHDEQSPNTPDEGQEEERDDGLEEGETPPKAPAGR